MSNVPQSFSHLANSDSISIESQSSVSTNATAPNLVGAGRTLGLAIDKAGSWLERCANRWATRRGHGPHEAAEAIRKIQADRILVAIPYNLWGWQEERRHVEIYPMIYPMEEGEKNVLRKKCKMLLAYTR